MGFDTNQLFPIKTMFSAFQFKRFKSLCSDKINFFVTSLSLSILYVLKDRYDIAKDIVQCIPIELYRKVRCLYF